jgi:predicted RNA-binding protein
MNYWLFTVTQKKVDGETLEAEDIFKQRSSDMFWGLGERTPNRRSVRRGDRVVFYVGWPLMIFAATATLASDSFSLSDEQKNVYGHGKTFYRADYGVELENIELFDSPRLVKEIVPSLKFIENKENWNTYFQGGIRQLSEDDFLTIVGWRSLTYTEPSKTDDTIISESQFALEAHLEEFIDKNWRHIDFGADLIRYEIDEQSGRQFPAGTWSIDFLCTDKSNGDFVVIELKRGRSSDSAVGQVLRYIGWVDENLAKPGQKTRGIILAKDVDDALRYAVKGLMNVSVLTYKVDFKLSPFKR